MPADPATPINDPDWSSWSTHRPSLSAAARRVLRHELDTTHPLPSVALAAARVPRSRITDGALAALRLAVGSEAVAVDDATRARHAGGQSLVDVLRRRAGDAGAAPDVVVSPDDAEQVAAVLDAAGKHRLAVVPRGGGTSVVGGLDPLPGAHRAVICLDLSRLDRLIRVDRRSLTATFQPGIRTPAAEAALAAHDLTLGHLPQSYERASLGGYVVTRSAGQASTGVGRIDDLFVGGRMTTPTGELVLGALPSSAAGPDLRRLVLGSEGTLGILTELTLRVRPVAATRSYEAWVVGDWQRGQAALRRIAQGDTHPDVVRLSDEAETRLSLLLGSTPGWQRRALATWLRVHRIRGGCLVVLGAEGERRDVRRRCAAARRALRAEGGVPIGARAGQSWRRHRFDGPALRDTLLDAGVVVETLETAATWTALPAVDAAVRAALRTELPDARVGCHVSHIYPTGASLYVTVLFPARRREDADSIITRWLAAKDAVSAAIVEAGGTVSHHHGVGTLHRRYAATDLGGDAGRRALAAVKHELDPAGILNPGKLLPPA